MLYFLERLYSNKLFFYFVRDGNEISCLIFVTYKTIIQQCR